jgi:cell wall-active antibiotic response 4TMS protein YvqF
MAGPRPEVIVFGLGLIALGTLGVLANLGRIDFLATVRTWWPLSLVLWGVLEVAQSFGRRRRSGGGS